MLGRYPRPGYIEIDGARGTVVQQASGHWEAVGEVRYCTDEGLDRGGVADQIAQRRVGHSPVFALGPPDAPGVCRAEQALRRRDYP